MWLWHCLFLQFFTIVCSPDWRRLCRSPAHRPIRPITQLFLFKAHCTVQSIFCVLFSFFFEKIPLFSSLTTFLALGWGLDESVRAGPSRHSIRSYGCTLSSAGPWWISSGGARPAAWRSWLCSSPAACTQGVSISSATEHVCGVQLLSCQLPCHSSNQQFDFKAMAKFLPGQ